jgi:L-phenylalanine/L-methionine N-acetyltransferase
MHAAIVIRRAEPDDYPGVRRVYDAPLAQADTLQLPYPSLELWRARMQPVDPNAHLLVAEAYGDIVGQAGLYVSGNARRRHVADLGMGVRDDWRGRGVGTAMLQAMITMADGWLQLRRIELQVYADNAAAIALYVKHGFAEEGRHRDFAYRDGCYVEAVSMARIRD